MTTHLETAAKDKPKLKYMGTKPLTVNEFRGVFTGETIPSADLGVRVNGGQQVAVSYYRLLGDCVLDERFDTGPMKRIGRGTTHVDVPFDYVTRNGERIVVYANARYYRKRTE